MEKPTWAQSEPDLCVQLEERPRFETLLANLSACFVNVPPDHVYAEIVDVQRSFCECLGFDLSALWQQPTGAPPPAFSCRLTTIDLWRGLRFPTACSTWERRVQRLQADAGSEKVGDDVREG